jgi:MFS family permease
MVFPPERSMSLIIVVTLAFLVHVGFAGSRVVVALFAVDQGATPFIVGTVVSLYAAVPIVLALPAGRMTDRLGYRIPMLFGTTVICGALLLPWLWPALTTLYFTATLLGIAFMAFQIATQTLVGAMSDPSRRAHNFNLISLGFATANFAGPLLSGVLIDQIGHRWTFFALAMPLVPAIIIAALGSRWIPDVHAKSEQQAGGSFELLRIHGLRNAMIASAIVSSAWDLYQFFLPIYGRAHGLSATEIGFVLSAFATSIIIVRIVLPIGLKYASPAQLLTYAMFVACTAYLMFPLFHTAWTMAIASFILGIGCGCGQPLSLTLVYNASPPGRAGESAGMRITANQAMHFTVPLLFGALGSIAGMTAVFLTNAGLLAIGGGFSQRNHAKVKTQPPT